MGAHQTKHPAYCLKRCVSLGLLNMMLRLPIGLPIPRPSCGRMCLISSLLKPTPPFSTDLNPLDHSVWGTLKEGIHTSRFTCIKDMRFSIQRKWKWFPQQFLANALNEGRRRSSLVVAHKNKGHHIGHLKQNINNHKWKLH